MPRRIRRKCDREQESRTEENGSGGLKETACMRRVWADRNARGSFESIHPELARRSGASVAVSAVGGPRDAATIEIQSDAIAVVREFVAINNLSADSDFIFHTGYLCHFTGLPMAFGNQASTVSTDVFRIGQFRSVGRLILHQG